VKQNTPSFSAARVETPRNQGFRDWRLRKRGGEAMIRGAEGVTEGAAEGSVWIYPEGYAINNHDGGLYLSCKTGGEGVSTFGMFVVEKTWLSLCSFSSCSI